MLEWLFFMLYSPMMYDLADARTDTLSATLLKMRLRAFVSGATDAAGKWALKIPEFKGFLLYLVVRGEGWIIPAAGNDRYHLRPGDCFLLTSGKSFVATSDLSEKRFTSIEDAIKFRKNDVITINGGGESFTIAIHFQFEGHLPGIIFRGLPATIHIPEHLEEAAALRSNIERFRAEYRGRSIGHLLVLNHLAPIILVQIFRMYLSSPHAKQSWLTSLSDPKLSKAIEAMHANPGKPWSLQSLAQLSAMSRAGFALNFKRKIGVTPGEYLTHWRMQIACDRLLEGAHTISSVASEVGYQSESAFSKTFARVVGCRPGSYRSAEQYNWRVPDPTSPNEASELTISPIVERSPADNKPYRFSKTFQGSPFRKIRCTP